VRGLDQPGIPAAEFVPRPPSLTTQSALWGVCVKTVTGHVFAAEVFGPDDIQVDGVALDWLGVEDPDRGVAYGRARDAWGTSIAVARAVPLS
jgi:hypothetical protein